MQIFLDTANIHELEALSEYGIVDGVTTNPSLLANTGLDTQLISKICNLVKGPVSVEVVETEYSAMREQALELSKISENIVIKLPINMEGIKTCYSLSKEGVRVNMTLCFSLNQAILAAKAGASFVSIFMGRIDDLGYKSADIIKDVTQVFRQNDSKTLVLAASIRHLQHIESAYLSGAQITTIPGHLVKKILDNPLTKLGLNKFLSDWENKRQEPLNNLL